MMKITLEPTNLPNPVFSIPSHPTISITVASDDLTLDGIVEEMIQPLLLAAGYPANLVNALGVFRDDDAAEICGDGY
jgi:hypothetical protein